MRLASIIAAALCVCMPAARSAGATTGLSVHLRVMMDRSITLQPNEMIAEREAAAIWQPYGVDLRWNDEKPAAALCLDVVVGHVIAGPHGVDAASVMGRVTIVPGLEARGPIQISLDSIESVLEPLTAHPLHDYSAAVAVGRVVAHEVGHVLLGQPSYHDAGGLMRARFPSDDLGRPERSRFRLADSSLARLRTRIPELLEAHAEQSCAVR